MKWQTCVVPELKQVTVKHTIWLEISGGNSCSA